MIFRLQFSCTSSRAAFKKLRVYRRAIIVADPTRPNVIKALSEFDL